MTRFPSSPLIRVPFFLLFGFNKGTQKEKGKRVLLGHLDEHNVLEFRLSSLWKAGRTSAIATCQPGTVVIRLSLGPHKAGLPRASKTP